MLKDVLYKNLVWFSLLWRISLLKKPEDSDLEFDFHLEIKLAVTVFFHNVLGKFVENTQTDLILCKCNISQKHKPMFFPICFLISFQSWLKEVKQIRGNIVCVLARHISVFCCALITGHYNSTYFEKRNRSFTAQISRLCNYLWLCYQFRKFYSCLLLTYQFATKTFISLRISLQNVLLK